MSKKPPVSFNPTPQFCYFRKENTVDELLQASTESKLEINADGTKIWRNIKNQLHRTGGLPAVEYADGSKFHYKNDLFHRDQDLPAVELNDGRKYWFLHGLWIRKSMLPAYYDPKKEININ